MASFYRRLSLAAVGLQSCERAVEDVGKPMMIAARENMVNLVAAMTREWEVATHNATLAARQVHSPTRLFLYFSFIIFLILFF